MAGGPAQISLRISVGIRLKNWVHICSEKFSLVTAFSCSWSLGSSPQDSGSVGLKGVMGFDSGSQKNRLRGTNPRCLIMSDTFWVALTGKPL